MFSGPRYGPRSLHHVLTLNHVAFKIPNSKFGFKVSLYYGICFDGCEIDWKRTATGAIEITKIIPKKSQKDYPYPGNPDLLPYFPLEIIEESEIASTEVEEEIYNTSWAVSSSCVYVIAHSHPELGIALFSPDEDVDIVFEYDPAEGKVRAANQCS